MDLKKKYILQLLLEQFVNKICSENRLEIYYFESIGRKNNTEEIMITLEYFSEPKSDKIIRSQKI